MRFERVIALVSLVAIVQAGLFSNDPKADRSKKRADAEK